MSKQTFSDESNYKHEPHAKHIVKDKFGKGSDTRNWKKNLNPEDEETEEEKKEHFIEVADDQPVLSNVPKSKSVKNPKKTPNLSNENRITNN